MFGSAVLEVAIGLVFIYTVLSVVSSMMQEGVAQWLDWRPKMLAEGVERLLLDTDVRKLFYEHPLIRSLQRKHPGGGEVHPSEISAATFSTVVFDIAESMAEASAGEGSKAASAPSSSAAGDEATPGSLREAYLHLRTVVSELPESALKTTLRAFLRSSEMRAESLKDSVENWFEGTMGEVSAWYKKRSQIVVLVFAVILTVAGNVDTVALAEALWTQPTVRDSLTTIAETYSAGNTAPGTSASASQAQSLQAIQSQVSALNLPLGWQEGFPSEPAGVLSKVLGLLLTSFAVSLGAQFWFGVLRKAVQLRKSTSAPSPAAPAGATSSPQA